MFDAAKVKKFLRDKESRGRPALPTAWHPMSGGTQI